MTTENRLDQLDAEGRRESWGDVLQITLNALCLLAWATVATLYLF